MKVKYDSKVDALYIDLAGGKYNKSKKVTDGILVDLTEDGKILGIEILDATKNIQQFDPLSINLNLQLSTSQLSTSRQLASKLR